MGPADLAQISEEQQTQRPFDLFLIFVGANIVATTLQVGASVSGTLPLGVGLSVIGVGALAGATLVAALAPIGTRLRVPSIVAARAALGLNGAQALALILFVTNFAWIALEQRDRGVDLRQAHRRRQRGRLGNASGTSRDAHRAGRPGDGRSGRSRGGSAAPGVWRASSPSRSFARRGRRRVWERSCRARCFAASTSWPATRCRGC